jgi:hypothetical protein
MPVSVGLSKALEIVALCHKRLVQISEFRLLGAGDGNRTRMASLEGWSSTIELHPRI